MCNTSDSESDVPMQEIKDVSCFSTPKKKKIKSADYTQKYKRDWEKERKWLQSSKKGPTYAWCKFCSCDNLIARGKGEIKKHITTAKHIKSISTIKSQPSVASVFGKKSKNIDEKAKEGVLRLAGFIAEHNLPIRLMEHISNLVKSICTDSEIAQAIKCIRTKMTNVIRNVTGD
ncbi:unnamed protein product [Acanthoscelides obtectus]|uniref:Uncharacterized protein n=1 Tax=Acanthoscelides obtectus TaxID=200917 RepID=A0A9P0JRS7_ACAOB|nr:unnamed protein product [Acanthoscelides obtectus]CAK1679245.1 hypothetical protein AOBTE_LOCUS32186 [Acanthoscelides obtectus]